MLLKFMASVDTVFDYGLSINSRKNIKDLRILMKRNGKTIPSFAQRKKKEGLKSSRMNYTNTKGNIQRSDGIKKSSLKGTSSLRNTGI